MADLNPEQRFPLDSATLIMLRAACQMNEETGQTHLHDFLDMGSREKSSTLISDGDGESVETAPAYEVEYEEGYEPWSEHAAIIALVGEVLRLRGEEA